MPIKVVRDKLGFVPQTAVLFKGTIRENIKFGNANATDDDINEALKVAQTEHFISKLPDGLNSFVAQGGKNFSGGQKQRVAIARTLITQAPVIIFDDSLSAVDTETDYEIRKSLQENTDRATTLIITHRVATAKDADLIIVLEDGKISQIGKHNDLINQEGLYKRICNIQTKMV